MVLKKLAQTCSFGSYLDEALRDQLVAGCYNPDIQKALLELGDEKFDTVYKVALAKELSIHKSKKVQREASSASSHLPDQDS